MKFTAALAVHDGSKFGEIYVGAHSSCNECLIYVSDIVDTINSIPGWTASGGPNGFLRVDFSGLGIGVKDPNLPQPGVRVLADALTSAELEFRIETLDFLLPDDFMLIVGSKP
jgi:hypothetical protein